jgi:Retrotransposon gag protein.
MFSDFAKFAEGLEKVFGDPDSQRHAQERLARLRQTKSAAAYAAQFRQGALCSSINNERLIQLFYNGLNEDVEDEVV